MDPLINKEDKFYADVELMIAALIPIMKIWPPDVGLAAMSLMMGSALASNPDSLVHNLKVMQDIISTSYNTELKRRQDEPKD